MLRSLYIASLFISTSVFHGKVLARFHSLLRSWTCSVSPKCGLLCFSSCQALFGMQVSSVEKLSTKMSYCLLPTHPFLPLLFAPPAHLITIPFPKGAGIWDETRSVVLPSLWLVLPGRALKSELWCLWGWGGGASV